MIVARILDPPSKLATARGLDEETSTSTLAEMLEVQKTDAQALYAAMDWLGERQGEIEKKLAKRHLEDGSLVLYDVSSTYFEGVCCPLGQRGHSRDGKKDKLQIVFGLLCNRAGCPVAVEVFDGNTADPKTLGSQIEKLRHRFKFSRIVLVGDRGMITEARIREEIQPIEGLDWITALRAPAICQLVEAGKIQLSFFDESQAQGCRLLGAPRTQRDLAEIQSPDYPGERLIVCKNPLMATRRAQKRQALLEATERELDKIVAATTRSRRPLKGEAPIGLRVGKILHRFKVAKHFRLDIREAGFSYARDEGKIAEEAALDGIYVVRTSVQKAEIDTEEAVRAYKDLGHVEQAFRSYKTIDLKVRPISHYLVDRVRAHVFLCMLTYYVEWHMRQALAPLLFDDDDKAAAEAQRDSPIVPAKPSPSAQDKARTLRTEDDFPVHSFQTLIADLATIAKNRIRPKLPGADRFDQFTRPTPLQRRAFDLLGVKL